MTNLEILKRIDKALAAWEFTWAFWHNGLKYGQYTRRLMVPSAVAAFSHWPELTTDLCSLRNGEADMSFVSKYQTDFGPAIKDLSSILDVGTGTESLPIMDQVYILQGMLVFSLTDWVTRGSHAFRLGPEIDQAVRKTSLSQSMPLREVWPSGTFAVLLESPVVLGNQDIDCLLVSIEEIPDEESHDVTVVGFSRQLSLITLPTGTELLAQRDETNPEKIYQFIHSHLPTFHSMPGLGYVQFCCYFNVPSGQPVIRGQILGGQLSRHQVLSEILTDDDEVATLLQTALHLPLTERESGRDYEFHPVVPEDQRNPLSLAEGAICCDLP